MNALCLFSAVVVGGIDMMAQSLILAQKPHIIIGKHFALWVPTEV
jgi:hypothetical protein